MKNGYCPKCHSSKIMRNLRVVDRDGEYPDGSLSVRTEQNPKALLFKGREDFQLSAYICGECGYAELFAMDPEKLWMSSQNKSA
jgi:ribosomal protein S27AE